MSSEDDSEDDDVVSSAPYGPSGPSGQGAGGSLLRPSDVLLWRPALFFVALGGTVALGALAAFRADWLLTVDRPVSALLHDQRWEPFFRIVTEVGRPWAVAVASFVAAAALWRRCRVFALALPATTLTAMVVDVGLKMLVSRPRPPFGIGATADPTSFPSGHVVLGVILLGFMVPVVYLVTAKRWAYVAALSLFAVYVPVVMASRIVIGAHWLTDVVGSLFIGATLLLGAEYLVGRPSAYGACRCRLHAVETATNTADGSET